MNLRLGYLERIPGVGWFALKHHEYLGRMKRFNHLGEALEYLGYNPIRAVPARAGGMGGEK
jgi:hypothetical protein